MAIINENNKSNITCKDMTVSKKWATSGMLNTGERLATPF
jgi:hypothetical protein